jgi:glutathionylspermidine synthase
MALGSGVVTSYGDFARELVAGGILGDPWVDGAPRFRMTPVVMTAATRRSLEAAAEEIALAHDEAARICARAPALVKRFFDLPPALQAMWELAAPAWHGIARADVFLTADGPRVCELNSDTPSGAPEAVALNRAVDGAGAALFDDPNARLPERIGDLVDLYAANVAGTAGPPATIGIVYPTEMTEDLSMIELYARWFAARGLRVVLGSPFNLAPDGRGGVSLFDVPCPVIWRHYKTDWWGERQPVWRSQASFPDAAPLTGPLALLGGAVARGRCAVINPFGALLTQNKRMMALMWEEIGLFSARAQAAIRRTLPYTTRLERLDRRQLHAERDLWVLKSDYGCEGDEVVIGRTTPPARWAAAIDDARPRRWIAQRRFDPLPSRAGGHANHGVYVIGGRAAGLFTRLHRDATDHRAVCAPTLVRLT